MLTRIFFKPSAISLSTLTLQGFQTLGELSKILNLSILFSASFLLSSCDYRSDRKAESETATDVKANTDTTNPSPQRSSTYNYAVFLENSGSMDGYVRGTTAFEDDIYKLLVDISYLADTVRVNYVNSQIIPYNLGIQKFINNMEPASFQQRGGNRSSSNINQVLQRVLQETQEGQVNVLISDFIFSIGGGDTEEKLNNQRISIYSTFRKQLQQNPFATLIIKMKSEFNGSYYDKTDRPIALNGVERPYYIWLTGEPAAINNFSQQIDLNQLEGFEYTYLMLPQTADVTPYYTVLNNYQRKGTFRADRQHSGADYVRGISNVEPSNRGEAAGTFGFSIAANLSRLPVGEDYLTDVQNYQLPDAYTLESVEPAGEVENMNARDKAMLEKATHIMTVSTTGKAYPDLRIALKKQTPAWVADTQTNDDSKIKTDEAQLDKTFGFGYLVGGVEDAYRSVNKQDEYFAIEVSVKK